MLETVRIRRSGYSAKYTFQVGRAHAHAHTPTRARLRARQAERMRTPVVSPPPPACEIKCVLCVCETV
jgi:hypothetical protein